MTIDAPDVYGLVLENGITPCAIVDTLIMTCFQIRYHARSTNDMEIVSKKDSAVQ